MSAVIQQERVKYLVHDLRTHAAHDELRQVAEELADEVMMGLSSLPQDQQVLGAHLFITDEGAKLLFFTWALEMSEVDKKLDCVLKSAIHGSSGIFYTYEIPILQRESDNTTNNE